VDENPVRFAAGSEGVGWSARVGDVAVSVFRFGEGGARGKTCGWVSLRYSGEQGCREFVKIQLTIVQPPLPAITARGR